ncbi:MAG: four helix bundle protein [Clostridia bacterium]
MKQEEILQLIPKAEKYLEYMLELLIKIPRTEKFSIGTEYKKSMYRMLENIMYLNKFKQIEYLNKIDVELNIQRVCLRILKKNKWIDIKKFNIAMDKIMEIGKILGGLIKYYGKNIKE